MFVNGLLASLSGMKSATRRTSNSANNLTNASTTGYTPTRINQADTSTGGTTVTGATSMQAGPIVTTGRPLDLAIDGGGFFVVRDGQGGEFYTRDGNFSFDNQGKLVDASGRTVAGGLEMPQNAAQVQVSPQGLMTAMDADGNVLAESQLQTAVFANPGGLEAIGGNAFRQTAASGPPVLDDPGAGGHGLITSGALQASGTDIGTEMVNLIISQRSFEANVRAVQTQDEMTSTVLDIVA